MFFKKKKPLGSLLSSIASYLRIFIRIHKEVLKGRIRQIRLVRKGNYFITYDNTYVDDGLATNHITDFLNDQKFMNAYKEGKETGAIKNHPGDIHYRAYIACYFAKYCSKLEGDFVECGVGQGLLSKTIVSYLNFEKINKIFFLFDTFEGIPIHQGKDSEIEMMNSMNKTHYHDFSKEDGNYYNQVCKTFSNYHNVQIIKGVVPESLKDISINKVSFFSVDMNNAFAEIEAIKFFWNKIVNYGIVLLDDYAYSDMYEEQRRCWNKFAKDKNIEICTLPTGQGLIIKN